MMVTTIQIIEILILLSKFAIFKSSDFRMLGKKRRAINLLKFNNSIRKGSFYYSGKVVTAGIKDAVSFKVILLSPVAKSRF